MNKYVLYPKTVTHRVGVKLAKDLHKQIMSNAGQIAAIAGQELWKHKSKLLDGAVKLVPKLRGPRKVIKDIFGFRARQVKTSKNAKRKAARYGKTGGATVGNTGAIVKTVNAPVAFARTFTGAPGFYLRHLDADTILVHSVDFVDTVALDYNGSGVGQFYTKGYQIEPSNEDIFSYVNPLLMLFSKWRMCMLRVHYVHYCPTAQAGAVAITWDPDIDGLPPVDMVEQLNTNGAVSGACYEDFSYECNPSQFNKDWFFMSDQGGADEDNRLVTEGEIQVSTDEGGSGGPTSSQKHVGRIIFESEFILTARRPSALSGLFSKMRKIAKTGATTQQKLAAMNQLCAKLIDVCSPKTHRQRHATIESILDTVREPRTETPSMPSGALTPINGRR